MHVGLKELYLKEAAKTGSMLLKTRGSCESSIALLEPLALGRFPFSIGTM